jgi:hypothetical protein
MSPWMLPVILGGIILLIVALIMIIRRHEIGSNGLTGLERKSLPREQREVLSMLRQHGGKMVQTEIADNIAGDIDYVIGLLMELEKKAKISRNWDAEKGVYLVSAVY